MYSKLLFYVIGDQVCAQAFRGITPSAVGLPKRPTAPQPCGATEKKKERQEREVLQELKDLLHSGQLYKENGEWKMKATPTDTQ